MPTQTKTPSTSALRKFYKQTSRRAAKLFGEDVVGISMIDTTQYRHPFMRPIRHMRRSATIETVMDDLATALVNAHSASEECNLLAGRLRYYCDNTTERGQYMSVLHKAWGEDVPVSLESDYGAFSTLDSGEVFRKPHDMPRLEFSVTDRISEDERRKRTFEYFSKASKALKRKWGAAIKQVVVFKNSYAVEMVARTNITPEEAERARRNRELYLSGDKAIKDWITRHELVLDRKITADLTHIVDGLIRSAKRQVMNGKVRKGKTSK
jgi:hypothetical protein